MSDDKQSLLGMTLNELKEAVRELGMPAFTGGQIARWLYVQHATESDAPIPLMHSTLMTERSSIYSRR